ncbi:MAG: hypothetical protein MK102_05190 [Fuerstiella sp.]|nr:hypothetical protein [Fuerstiella sp.]
MPSPTATKANEKQQACKKLTSLLHKDYGSMSVPKLNLPVLETMLFAACLEDNSWEEAEQGYERLNRLYYDLNEVRVSSVAEIEETLCGVRSGDWAGLRIRSILRFVFESTYTYDYEKLKRLTQDSAQKRLKKINNMSPFIRNFTVQHSLGGYLVCLDKLSTRAAIHLGIVPPDSTEEQAGDFLKPGLKKAETHGFTCALRCLATDPQFVDRLSEPPDEDEEFNVKLVEERYHSLKKPRKRKKKKKPPVVATKAAAKKKKQAGEKSDAGKKAVKARSVKSSSSEKTASKAGTKKTVKKKTVKKTSSVKKQTSRKKTTAARKKTTGKSTAARSTGKKTKTKKTVSKTVAAKRKPAKKKTTGRKKSTKKK